ncbi:hypothetical protein ZIOFF_047789 [Zingiber officinale]|uniref:cytokinin riboside 5'-monophosphate phosphoribohydrolase n=1 Tax=Zingiber officinale TaxID=94328 RepID=A0A8J5FYJ8_ZINOF|nr:hypothetical protein ZIOFF_047789 [Zingiber officinale]
MGSMRYLSSIAVGCLDNGDPRLVNVMITYAEPASSVRCPHPKPLGKQIVKEEFDNPRSRLLQIAEHDERIPGISLRLATVAEHWICVSFFDIELLDSMEGAKSVGSVEEAAATTAEKRSRFRRICVFCGSQCGKKPSYQEAAIELGKELRTEPIASRREVVVQGLIVLSEDYFLAFWHDGLLAVICLSLDHPSRVISADRTKKKAIFYLLTEANNVLPWDRKELAMASIPLIVNSGIDLVYGGGSIGLMGLVSHAVHEGVFDAKGGEVREVSDMHERKAEMARQADAFIALPGGYGTLEELLEVITWAQLGIHKKPVGLLNVDGFYNSLLSFIDVAVEEGFISQAARHIIISAHSAKELMRKLEEYIPQYESKLVWDTTEQKHLSFVPEPESGVAS